MSASLDVHHAHPTVAVNNSGSRAQISASRLASVPHPSALSHIFGINVFSWSAWRRSNVREVSLLEGYSHVSDNVVVVSIETV